MDKNTSFSPNLQTKDGLSSWCRECVRPQKGEKSKGALAVALKLQIRKGGGRCHCCALSDERLLVMDGERVICPTCRRAEHLYGSCPHLEAPHIAQATTPLKIGYGNAKVVEKVREAIFHDLDGAQENLNRALLRWPEAFAPLPYDVLLRLTKGLCKSHSKLATKVYK